MSEKTKLPKESWGPELELMSYGESAEVVVWGCL